MPTQKPRRRIEGITVGSFVVVRFPQMNAESSKYRPALVVAEGPDVDSIGQRWILVCAVTSSPRRTLEPGSSDIPIVDFAAQGLDKESVVQSQKVFTTQTQFVVKNLSKAPAELVEHAQRALRQMLSAEREPQPRVIRVKPTSAE